MQAIRRIERTLITYVSLYLFIFYLSLPRNEKKKHRIFPPEELSLASDLRAGSKRGGLFRFAISRAARVSIGRRDSPAFYFSRIAPPVNGCTREPSRVNEFMPPFAALQFTRHAVAEAKIFWTARSRPLVAVKVRSWTASSVWEISLERGRNRFRIARHKGKRKVKQR